MNIDYMEHELSKREKKIARVCIDKGLDIEYREALERVESVLQTWRNAEIKNNKEAYMEMWRAIREEDRSIGLRYNDMKGSRYLGTVIDLYFHGYINSEDIEGFNDGTKEEINRRVEIMKKY